MALVYQARNLKNGNLYVGVTRYTLERRRRKHLNEAARGQRGRFYNAIRKHGPDAFEFTVVKEVATYQEALAEEIAQIAALKPAYNRTKGGDGALGYKHDKATKEKMRQAKLGKPGPWAGKKRPAAHIEKMRAAKLANPQRYWLGKKRDAATIEKIRLSKTGRTPTNTPALAAARSANIRLAVASIQKRVICLDDGRTFESARAASAAYGFEPRAVAAVCGNPAKRKSIYGLRFAYLAGE